MTEPDMTHGTVEMVSVEWILQSLGASVDGYGAGDGVDFARMIAYKSGDSCFGPLVKAIIETGFRVPIVIALNRDGVEFTLGNGHHRVVAAILLVLDQIPVYWSDYQEDGDYMASETSAPDEYALDRTSNTPWSDLHDELYHWWRNNPIV